MSAPFQEPDWHIVLGATPGRNDLLPPRRSAHLTPVWRPPQGRVGKYFSIYGRYDDPELKGYERDKALVGLVDRITDATRSRWKPTDGKAKDWKRYKAEIVTFLLAVGLNRNTVGSTPGFLDMIRCPLSIKKWLAGIRDAAKKDYDEQGKNDKRGKNKVEKKKIDDEVANKKKKVDDAHKATGGVRH